MRKGGHGMELGQKLKQARLEQGLSQRQLCGEVITRNMLSLIENGAASPSMETLRYLASKLGEPMSYFLEEETVTSPNRKLMEQARAAFDAGSYELVIQQLENFFDPDETFRREEALLRSLSLMYLAEKMISSEKTVYALELLEKAGEAGKLTPYYTKETERQRLLLRAQLVPTELPVDDRELLLRAEAALNDQKADEAARYLEAAQNRSGLRWNYLRGKAYLLSGDYANAQTCLEASWEHDPKSCAAMLEQCCREQEDFKGAYRYACFLRDQE